MSDDKLRAFIKDNKSEFDSEKAPARVWDRIDNDLTQGKGAKSVSMKQLWMILAAVLVMFSVGIYFGANYFSNGEPQQMIAGIEDQDFQEMQDYYGPLLERKQQVFVGQMNEPSIIDELSELDQGFQELQSDFVNTSANNKEMMMKLMKENYELRIKILEMAMGKIKIDPSQNKSSYEREEY